MITALLAVTAFLAIGGIALGITLFLPPRQLPPPDPKAKRNGTEAVP